jgi:Flp pilus assembly protein TadD
MVPSSGREGYLLMSDIRRTLDSGRGVELQQALRLIELVPDSSYGRFLAGSVYLRNKDIENARVQFIRASELDPANGHALSALGDIALEAGDLTEADQYYSKAHEAAPSNVTANRLALLRIRGGYLESAKEILEKALTDDPADIMTRNNLAIAMDMMGTTSEGINILAMDEMADPRILRTMALLQLKEGRPERAAMDLKTVYDAGISEGEWLLMGTVDLQQGKLSPAEDKFRSAIVAQPSGYEGYLNLGLTLRRQGRFTEAEKTYQEGLARASHPDLHLNLGVLYELYRGEPSLALEQYRKYLELEGPASDRVRGWVEYLEGVVEGK